MMVYTRAQLRETKEIALLLGYRLGPSGNLVGLAQKNLKLSIVRNEREAMVEWDLGKAHLTIKTR
jgi:hypothetical protein